MFCDDIPLGPALPCVSSTFHAVELTDVSKKKYSTKKTSRRKNKAQFKDYWLLEKVEQGIQEKSIVKGTLRINHNNIKEAYVTVKGLKHDVFIQGESNRNRSLEGDEVAVLLNPVSEWRKKLSSLGMKQNPEECYNDTFDCNRINRSEDEEDTEINTKPGEDQYQATGVVVYIFTQCEHRKSITGFVRPSRDTGKLADDDKYVRFVPLDRKWPRMIVPIDGIDTDSMKKDSIDHMQCIYVAKLHRWDANSALPIGKITKKLGNANEFEPQINACLIDNGFDPYVQFHPHILSSLNDQYSNWSITQDEREKRKDLTRYLTFTIDPENSNDLDDALSVRSFGDDTFEIGIHIADVSHFVPHGSLIDQEARSRVMSLYLAHKVIPMLPPILSEDLCSLKPGEEKLAFSILINVNKNGQIIHDASDEPSIWIGKTIIKSRAKLSYEMAEKFISNQFKCDTDEDLIPMKHRAIGETVTSIAKDIQILHSLASKRREHRINSGAVQIEQSKLIFNIVNRRINSITSTSTILSNHLVEEMMIMANHCVAKKLLELKCKTLLRRHSHPAKHKMMEFENIYLRFIPNPTEIGNTFPKMLCNIQKHDNELIRQYLNFCIKKFMPMANYFVLNPHNQDSANSSSNFHHFALNLSCYTHFTSPIRRYSDLVVHRMLDRLLQTNETNLFDNDLEETIEHVMERCNEKKRALTKTQDRNIKAMLCSYFQQQAGIFKALITGISSRYISIFIPDLGIDGKIAFEKYQSSILKRNYDKNSNSMNISWKNRAQVRFEPLQEIQVKVCTIAEHDNPIRELEFLLADNQSYQSQPNKQQKHNCTFY